MSRLFIVSTPIGNLKDITLRAIDVLKAVDYILAEDTRHTRKLLQHYNIHTPIISYRDQNHARVVNKVVQFLKQGKDLALVSDAGTPLVSDPGYKLVRDLYSLSIADFKIVPIPGPSALTAAISVSPIPIDKFVFLGFLPHKSGKRKKLLETHGNVDASIVLYESPYRILKLLDEILEVLGDRDLFVARELTKKFETNYFGKVSILKEKFAKMSKIKGEFVVIIGK